MNELERLEVAAREAAKREKLYLLRMDLLKEAIKARRAYA